MESATGDERQRTRFDALYEQAKETVGYSANQVRALTELARQILAEMAGSAGQAPAHGGPPRIDLAADDVARRQGEVTRLELAVRNLEQSWLFLERGIEPAAPTGEPPDDAAAGMRILDAQEAERSRLAQEIHDGPAQSLANAVFVVDIIERLMERDEAAARKELRSLRELLNKELSEMRSFINQLRPPLLDELGLGRALREAAEQVADSIEVRVDLAAPDELLSEAQQTVVLRVAQEALRNIRKHAAASSVEIRTAYQPPDGEDASAWMLEVRDDGRGFDVAQVLGGAGDRNFGLRFMRERAELIGADLAIDSGVTGTSVRLTISGPERR
ncbi:MAG TPA: sensor histidine kinase [Candidatus Limnocylindrales bacterium]|nr:sensor histidine kinase [Candidatus Limnocylindrales bacterium]